MENANPLTTAAPFRIGWFISPHGFGHAARAAAIMDALHTIEPSVKFEIFTKVPEFFFKESLPENSFNYNSLMTDIGLAQKSSLDVDLPETIRRLDALLPFKDEVITNLAAAVKKANCKLIVCDIAPMGIVVADKVGIPSLLVENFTWDWIYDEFRTDDESIAGHIDYFKELFESADYHIQTEPARPRGNCDLKTSPVSRKLRTSPDIIRNKLNIPENAKMVMVTMGGIPAHLPFLHRLSDYEEIRFVIPGSPTLSFEDNLIRLPYNSDFYHPDLINACDAVVGKPGYSTVAEVYHAGVPFAYIPRPIFRESAVLEEFIDQKMSGFAITEEQFYEGQWLERLAGLLTTPRINRTCGNGAVQAAKFILTQI